MSYFYFLLWMTLCLMNGCSTTNDTIVPVVPVVPVVACRLCRVNPRMCISYLGHEACLPGSTSLLCYKTIQDNVLRDLTAVIRIVK